MLDLCYTRKRVRFLRSSWLVSGRRLNSILQLEATAKKQSTVRSPCTFWSPIDCIVSTLNALKNSLTGAELMESILRVKSKSFMRTPHTIQPSSKWPLECVKPPVPWTITPLHPSHSQLHTFLFSVRSRNPQECSCEVTCGTVIPDRQTPVISLLNSFFWSAGARDVRDRSRRS